MRILLLALAALLAFLTGPPSFPYNPADPRDPPPPTPWTRENVQAIYVTDGMPVAKEIEGRTCVETTGEPDSRYLYFEVDDTCAFDLDEPVELRIEFDTSVSKTIHIDYDSSFGSETFGGSYHTIEAAADTAARWAQCTISLERARFANRQNGGADLRITAPNWVVRISDLRISRPAQAALIGQMGGLKLTVIDGSTNKPTPARLGLYNAKGQFQAPNKKAVPINVNCRTVYFYPPRFEWTWPVRNQYVFYTHGQYECTLLAGQYEIVAKKGIEYRMVHQTLTIESGKTLEHTITLNRWADLTAGGWYSGDNHIHIQRTPEQNHDVITQIRAEDVHVANLLQVGDIKGCSLPQYAAGEKGRYQEDNYVLVSGQEDPRTDHRGHTIFLNLKSLFHDDETYYLYHQAFEEARRQGGLVGYAHNGLGFFADRGMALDMPFNLVDFLEVLQRAKCEPSIWYEFLNMGYKLVPSAGSDFPYLDPVGGVRNYVHIDGPFSPQAWFDGFAKGHTFVTNGPMLTFTVNGAPMGSELTARRGDVLNIEATAAINPDIDTLTRLELIVHGKPVKQVESTNVTESLKLVHTLTVDRSMWIAAKAGCKSSGVAHTAPVYVLVDGEPFWEPAAVAELVAAQRQRLRDLFDKPIKITEHWLSEKQNTEWLKQKPLIEPRIQQANTAYDALLKRLSSK